MKKYKHIVLIDDNEIDNYINEHVVKKANLAETVTVKNSAEDALKYLSSLHENFPEIIFLDIRMPIMDGFGFLQRFESFADENKSGCHIFMLSSSNDNNDISMAQQNPYVKNYLNKPLDNKKLELIFSGNDSNFAID